ncbi:MAG TPA: site-2 protease family protein, partial [Kofleriaceae bacterium]|nr:site-2 protease family protein [Kofleriaceae bacterium]
MHLTLLILLAWIAGSYMFAGAGITATGLGLLLVLTIFVIIVVHELGHALVARHFGIATRDIMLLPIGGIASLERMPEKPSQELAVAIVGPLINLALAGVLWIGIAAAGGTLRLTEVTTFGGALATQLLWINIALAVFNLIPAFPMDGGRVLRSVLAMRMSHERATDIAARLGKA